MAKILEHENQNWALSAVISMWVPTAHRYVSPANVTGQNEQPLRSLGVTFSVLFPCFFVFFLKRASHRFSNFITNSIGVVQGWNAKLFQFCLLLQGQDTLFIAQCMLMFHGNENQAQMFEYAFGHNQSLPKKFTLGPASLLRWPTSYWMF